MNTSANLNGLILAGGKSSRMGSDKSFVSYHGKPQVQYLKEILGKFCHSVFVSRKEDTSVFEGIPVITDQFEFNTPLNGILSAFKAYPDSTWITSPVDMPLITEEAIVFLLQHRDSKKIATCFLDSEDKNPEPLFTVWEPGAYPLLLKFIEGGNFSPRDFLKQSLVNLLKAPTGDILININTTEELNTFKMNFNSRTKL